MAHTHRMLYVSIMLICFVLHIFADQVCDDDAIFTVAGVKSNYIKVQEPGPGHAYEVDRTLVVKWDNKVEDVPFNNVSIDVINGDSNNGRFIKRIADNVDFDQKTLSWTVDKDLPTGFDYFLRVSGVSQEDKRRDFAFSTRFTIVNPEIQDGSVFKYKKDPIVYGECLPSIPRRIPNMPPSNIVLVRYKDKDGSEEPEYITTRLNDIVPDEPKRYKRTKGSTQSSDGYTSYLSYVILLFTSFVIMNIT